MARSNHPDAARHHRGSALVAVSRHTGRAGRFCARPPSPLRQRRRRRSTRSTSPASMSHKRPAARPRCEGPAPVQYRRTLASRRRRVRSRKPRHRSAGRRAGRGIRPTVLPVPSGRTSAAQRGRAHLLPGGVGECFGLGRRDLADGLKHPSMVAPASLPRGPLTTIATTAVSGSGRATIAPVISTFSCGSGGRPGVRSRLRKVAPGPSRARAVKSRTNPPAPGWAAGRRPHRVHRTALRRCRSPAHAGCASCRASGRRARMPARGRSARHPSRSSSAPESRAPRYQCSAKGSGSRATAGGPRRDHSTARVQPSPGSKAVIAAASLAVSGPRSCS